MVKASDVLGDNENNLNTPNGIIARKGSIAAMLQNAARYEELIALPEGPHRTAEMNKIVSDVIEILPALHAVHLFEFFTPDEWLHGLKKGKQGRAFIATLYLLHHPKTITHDIIDQLVQSKNAVAPEFLRIIDQLLNKSQGIPEGSVYDE